MFTLERRRVYLPLVCTSVPPPLEFNSGVAIVDLKEEDRPDLGTWDEILSKKEIRRFNEVERWFVYDYSAEVDAPFADSVVADTFVALQVAAPIGSHDFTTVFQSGDTPSPTFSITRRSPLHSTGWARMVGYDGITASEICRVVNTIATAFRTNRVRLVNPVRFLENGLYSTNGYLRTMLWVTGLDSLMMAINKKIFVTRLCNFLGSDTQVFPLLGGIIGRPYTVGSVAADLFQIRSEIAHGKAISKKFWSRLPPVALGTYETGYQGLRTYAELLEEAAILLLCMTLRKIVLSDLVDAFASERTWKKVLSS
jgi:hypothetical protein